jgi:hypothetical protein
MGSRLTTGAAPRHVGDKVLSKRSRCLPEKLSIVFPVLYLCGGKYDRLEESTVEAASSYMNLRRLDAIPHRLLALLFTPPRPGTLRQLDVVINGKGNHGFPQLPVIAAMKLQVHDIAAAIAPITVKAARWVDIEAWGFIFVVGQRAATVKPRSATERLEVGIATCDLLNGNRLAHGFTALTEAVGIVW